MQRVLFIVFVFRTDVRTLCVKLMTTYLQWPGGSTSLMNLVTNTLYRLPDGHHIYGNYDYLAGLGGSKVSYFFFSSLITYMKLFAAMGLTWSLEVLAWFLSDESNPPPEWLILTLNMFNIFQGPVIFLVFTFKPATAQKLKPRLAAFASRLGVSWKRKSAVVPDLLDSAAIQNEVSSSAISTVSSKASSVTTMSVAASATALLPLASVESEKTEEVSTRDCYVTENPDPGGVPFIPIDNDDV